MQSLTEAILPRKQVFAHFQRGFDVAFNIEVVVDVSFPQREFAGVQEHRPQGSGVLEDERKARLVCSSPRASIPKTHPKIMVGISGKQVLEKIGADLDRSLSGDFGQESHGISDAPSLSELAT